MHGSRFVEEARIHQPRTTIHSSTTVYSVAHYATMHDDFVFDAFLPLSSFALLRTGELLLVKPCSFLLTKERGPVTLEGTKTGKRDVHSWHWQRALEKQAP